MGHGSSLDMTKTPATSILTYQPNNEINPRYISKQVIMHQRTADANTADFLHMKNRQCRERLNN